MGMLLLILTVFLVTDTIDARQFQVKNLVGVWKNQLGSVFNISDVSTESYELRGTYISGSGTNGAAYPVIGSINELPSDTSNQDKHTVLVVSFTVNWGKIGSVTTWNGFVEEGNRLVAQWLLVRPVSSFLWDHILTGQDIFTKFEI